MNQSYPVHNRTLQTETEANAVTQHTLSLFNLKPQSHRKPSIHSKLRWGQLIHLIFVVRFCSKVDQRLGKKMIHSCFDLRVDVFTRLWPNDKGQQCRVRADIQQRGNTQSKQSVGAPLPLWVKHAVLSHSFMTAFALIGNLLVSKAHFFKTLA